METIRLASYGVEEAAASACEILRAGGVILYPTDTLYGLGAAAFSDDAVGKIYAIKGRDEKKPIHAIVADIEMAKRYAQVSDVALVLAQKFLPGPLTLILKKRFGFDSGIERGMGTIGVRIPASDFCLALAKRFDAPYTTTSANLAGRKSLRDVGDILTQLGDSSSAIDLVVDAGELPERRPSTIVDVSSDEPKILREGAIVSDDIFSALHGYFT